jgi:hypothetical protein
MSQVPPQAEHIYRRGVLHKRRLFAALSVWLCGSGTVGGGGGGGLGAPRGAAAEPPRSSTRDTRHEQHTQGVGRSGEKRGRVALHRLHAARCALRAARMGDGRR